jgi:hypothetical protein
LHGFLCDLQFADLARVTASSTVNDNDGAVADCASPEAVWPLVGDVG